MALTLSPYRAQSVDMPVVRLATAPFDARVGCDAGPGQRRLHRCDVDDPAFAPSDHVACDGLADVEDGRDVGAHQPLERVRIEILQRAAMLHAGVVDQDVDGTGPGFMAVHGGPHRRVVAGVEGQCRHRGPLRLEPCLRLGELRLVTSVQDQPRPDAGQPFGQRMADAREEPVISAVLPVRSNSPVPAATTRSPPRQPFPPARNRPATSLRPIVA